MCKWFELSVVILMLAVAVVAADTSICFDEFIAEMVDQIFGWKWYRKTDQES